MRINFKITSALAGVVAGLAVTAASAPARADRRAYTTTYEAVTAPKGELDVEMWSSYAHEGELLDGPASRGFRNMLELEYGITDRWDMALYNMIDVTSDSTNSGYAGAKLETRYRILPAGSWVLDPIIYFEAQYLRRGDARETFETKLILARDQAAWNFAFNVSYELEHLVDGGWNPELEYAVGVSRELAGPDFKLGLEAFGKNEKQAGHIETFAWAGPALSWATRFQKGMEGIWVTVGGGHGLTDESDAWYGRAIVGLQF
jgi:hypothetical protein